MIDGTAAPESQVDYCLQIKPLNFIAHYLELQSVRTVAAAAVCAAQARAPSRRARYRAPNQAPPPPQRPPRAAPPPSPEASPESLAERTESGHTPRTLRRVVCPTAQRPEQKGCVIVVKLSIKYCVETEDRLLLPSCRMYSAPSLKAGILLPSCRMDTLHQD